MRTREKPVCFLSFLLYSNHRSTALGFPAANHANGLLSARSLSSHDSNGLKAYNPPPPPQTKQTNKKAQSQSLLVCHRPLLTRPAHTKSSHAVVHATTVRPCLRSLRPAPYRPPRTRFPSCPAPVRHIPCVCVYFGGLVVVVC